MDYGPGAALVVVDMQNDFADPSGGLYVQHGEMVVPVVNHHIEAAQRAGSPVFYTQDWHPEVTPHFAKDGGIWPVHCIGDTWGAEFHPDLTISGPAVRKGTGGEDGYSGFTMRDPVSGEERSTELEAMLRNVGATSVMVLGLALDYCVKATALDAAAAGFETWVDLDATKAVNLEPGDGDAAVVELRNAGVAVG